MKALITGASSGIGRSFAYYLATLGYELVLTSQEKTKLEQIKKNLTVPVTIIPCDLLKESNVYALYEKTKNMNIDVVINNAGFGLFGEFAKTDLNRELEMIDLNVRAYHILTKLFLQDFVKKDAGYILNVCSSAGFMAGPRMATYYATKNYITKLTMAINEELRQKSSHVQISALCPGPVNTNFNHVAQGKFTIKGISPDYVAKYAIKKMFQHKLIIIPTLKMKLAVWGQRFIPYRWALIITYHIQYRKTQKK